MTRGTTPTQIFSIPFDTSAISKVEITYKQNNILLLTKHTEHCTLCDNTISVTLTQEETFLFNHRHVLKIQLRVVTKNGKVPASNIITENVYECQSNEVL